MIAKRLRFGIRFNSESGTIQEVVRWAQLAEALGFDDMWYCEDLFQRDAWIALTAVAAATRRIRVGTCIVNPFSSSPVEIAMRTASLQDFSEGRFVLGIGPGDPPMLEWAGLRQRRPLSGLREAVELLRRMLRGEAAAFDGAVFRGWTDQARLKFRVPAAPIPIYIGGQGPKVLEYMGEAGDGGLPVVFPPEIMDTVAGHVRAGAARASRSLDNFDLAACVWWSIGNTPAEAQAALRPLIAYYGPSLREETLAPIGLSPADFDPIHAALKAGEIARAQSLVRPEMFRLAIAGDPEQLTERVRWLAARGATQINIGPPLGLDKERALRLTAERVIAKCR